MEPVLMRMEPVTPDMATISNLKAFTPKYDAKRDVFFLRPSTPRPATSFDCDGELWLRVDVNTGEIVGIEIEDFEAVFLKRHPEVAQAWAECKRLVRSQPDRIRESFLVILAGFLRSFLSDCSTQQSMEMMPA
jgi:uncharacterized protein YuzE